MIFSARCNKVVVLILGKETVKCHKYPVGTSHHERRSYLLFYVLQKERKVHKEEVLGDTAFFVLIRLECYDHRYHTVKDIEKICGSEEENCWSSNGYIQMNYIHMVRLGGSMLMLMTVILPK